MGAGSICGAGRLAAMLPMVVEHNGVYRAQCCFTKHTGVLQTEWALTLLDSDSNSEAAVAQPPDQSHSSAVAAQL